MCYTKIELEHFCWPQFYPLPLPLPPPPSPSPQSHKSAVKHMSFAKLQSNTPSKVNTFTQNIKPNTYFLEEISKMDENSDPLKKTFFEKPHFWTFQSKRNFCWKIFLMFLSRSPGHDVTVSTRRHDRTVALQFILGIGSSLILRRSLRPIL